MVCFLYLISKLAWMEMGKPRVHHVFFVMCWMFVVVVVVMVLIIANSMCERIVAVALHKDCFTATHVNTV